MHYIFEPGTFVPVAQAMIHRAIDLPGSADSTGDYSLEDDPLWNHKVSIQPVDVLNWYQCDHLGTPRELTDAQGEIAWTAEYKAWGSVLEQRSSVARREGVTNPIRFQGQYHDHETGLHYNRHRYYDPDTGRFIGQDPISYVGGLNLYSYAPNPTGWIDPLGLAKTCCCGEPYVNQDTRWRQVMEDPNTPSSMRGWIKNQASRVDAGKQANIKAPPGYELAHRPRFENDSGYDYSHADPMLAADHRGIQHRYWRKRGGCWNARMPKSGFPGTGKLSLPKRGALP